MAGGGAKSALWRKIVASVLGLPIVTVNSTEGAAFGAALLAGVGAGAWPTCRRPARRRSRSRDATSPWPSGKATRDLYPRYRELYTALKPTYDALPR